MECTNLERGPVVRVGTDIGFVKGEGWEEEELKKSNLFHYMFWQVQRYDS